MGRWKRGRVFASVPNLIRLSVRYDSVLNNLRIFLALNFSCVPSMSNNTTGAILCLIRTIKDNTILVCRLAMWLICTFLRMVWGGGKGEGYSPSVRASTQPDTTVGTVRFRTLYLKNFSRSKSHLCPFYSNKGALLCPNCIFNR